MEYVAKKHKCNKLLKDLTKILTKQKNRLATNKRGAGWASHYVAVDPPQLPINYQNKVKSYTMINNQIILTTNPSELNKYRKT